MANLNIMPWRVAMNIYNLPDGRLYDLLCWLRWRTSKRYRRACILNALEDLFINVPQSTIERESNVDIADPESDCLSDSETTISETGNETR